MASDVTHSLGKLQEAPKIEKNEVSVCQTVHAKHTEAFKKGKENMNPSTETSSACKSTKILQSDDIKKMKAAIHELEVNKSLKSQNMNNKASRKLQGKENMNPSGKAAAAGQEVPKPSYKDILKDPVAQRAMFREMLPILREKLAFLQMKEKECLQELEEDRSDLEFELEDDDEPEVLPPESSTRRSSRNVTKVCYKEDNISDDDDYLYCDRCEKLYKKTCPKHELLIYAPRKRLPKNGSIENRAFHTIPSFLSLGLSKIKNAGNGIWTEIDLPVGIVFGPYEGTMTTDPKEAFKSGFCWQITKGSKVDHYVEAGDMSTSNWLRFVNCAKSESQQNLISFQFKGRIYYRTCKPILKYCELLVWYGDNYAEHLGLDLSKEDPVQKKNLPGFPCDVCQRCFTSEDYLNRHRKTHRDQSSSLKHRCEFCSYSTNNSTHIKQHLLTHTGEKPYQCLECGKSFSHCGNLERHLRIHTGEKPYQCNLCDQRFNDSSTLQTHQLTHSGSKPHLCTICEKAFSRMSSLQTHLRIHNNQTPYTCFHCQKRFSDKSNLESHIILKHTRCFPHNCPECGKGFTAPCHLAKHMQKHHK